jgi:hypothetical protein
MNILSSYFGLIDARMSAFDKDSAVPVEVWPKNLLHANNVRVERKACANIAHHNGNVIDTRP